MPGGGDCRGNFFGGGLMFVLLGLLDGGGA